MGKPQKKRMRKGLVIALAVLVVVLAISNILVYADLQTYITGLANDKNNLQTQLNALDTTYKNYTATHSHTDSAYNSLNKAYQDYMAAHTHTDSEYNSLQSQITSLSSLQSQIASLNSQISSLNAEIAGLQVAQLYEVDLKWDFNETSLGSSVHVYGAVFNSGTNTANSAKINAWLYDSNRTLVKSFTINLGDISGKTYQNVNTTIDYSGHCATHSYQIVHS